MTPRRSIIVLNHLPTNLFWRTLVPAAPRVWRLLAFVILLTTSGRLTDAAEPPPKIQVALLLDTSNSMDGMIAQAKSQLWKIVNECSHYRSNGVLPSFEVALFEHGKSLLPAETGYIRRVLPFTSDLDAVAEQLFGLSTQGGEEYCGLAVHRAVSDLKWSDNAQDLKLIFIAGNEPFTQGPYDYRIASAAAIHRGIVVNTIHCGDERMGIATGWREGALLAEGSYASFEQDRPIVAVSTPFDEEITRLGIELNKTYVAYGRAGKSSLMRQSYLDSLASKAAAIDSNVERQIAKASANYRNESWDLVDAVQNATVDLSEIDTHLLPGSMQQMTAQERIRYLESKADRRVELRKQIATLQAKREKFLREQELGARSDGVKSLDEIIVSGIRERAEAKGFKRSP